MKRVLVCGGRDYTEFATTKGGVRGAQRAYAERGTMFDEFTRLHRIWNRPFIIITGGGSGADAWADALAKNAKYPCIRHPANWEKLGAEAGPLRNQEMIDMWEPDLVLAFAVGRDTEDMVRRAKAAGIEVRLVD